MCPMNGKCMYKEVNNKASIRYNDQINFIMGQLQTTGKKLFFIITKYQEKIRKCHSALKVLLGYEKR